MQIANNTGFEDGVVVGPGSSGDMRLGVVVKGTFLIPQQPDGVVVASAEQLELLTGDEYFDGDVMGSVQFEADAVVEKPLVDVVVVGRAYAPGGRPSTRVNVALRVGRHEWALQVTGSRQWLFPSRAVLVPAISDPEPFLTVPLRYERAYGGFDHRGKSWCAENPIGRGYIGKKTRESVHEALLPNIESPQKPIRSWDDRPPTAGFGFVRKDWLPRSRYAGSVAGTLEPDDDTGLAADFDPRFFNAAHPDLQISNLAGDETIELQHLTEDGYRRFRLPGTRLAATFVVIKSGHSPTEDNSMAEGSTEALQQDMRLDTLVLLPDRSLLYLVWRASISLKTIDMDSIHRIMVAPVSATR